MRTKDLLSLSTRMFQTRPMRTLLTILGVGIGIGAVLFLVSLGYGMQNVILNQITTADTLLSLDVAPGNSDLIKLDQENIDKIESLDNVNETARSKTFSSQLSSNGLASDSNIFSIDPNYFRLNGLSADHGALFESTEEKNIVISSATVKLFNSESDKILNQEVAITLYVPFVNDEGYDDIEIVKIEESYKIVGIINDETVSYAYIPLDTITEINVDNFDNVKVKVSEEQFAEPIRDQIINQGFIVSSLSDIIEQTNKIFGIVQLVLALFGMIALIVSAIGMFNTMTITLLERTNEIGIMRSIGVTQSDIQKLFLIESMLMGFLGGLGGLFLGWLAGELANLGINMLAGSLGGTSLDLFYQPSWFIIVIMVFSTFIGFLTGVFPAKRASKMDPLEALRYK